MCFREKLREGRFAHIVFFFIRRSLPPMTTNYIVHSHILRSSNLPNNKIDLTVLFLYSRLKLSKHVHFNICSYVYYIQCSRSENLRTVQYSTVMHSMFKQCCKLSQCYNTKFVSNKSNRTCKYHKFHTNKTRRNDVSCNYNLKQLCFTQIEPVEIMFYADFYKLKILCSHNLYIV